MYTVEILHPITKEVIETRCFNSEYEAIHYGEQYQNFINRTL